MKKQFGFQTEEEANDLDEKTAYELICRAKGLLGATVKRVSCVDKHSTLKRIVIEYDHETRT